jgi:mono/diheme cytochrome c family protein
MKKILLSIISIVVILILIFVVYINLSWDQEFDAPYPEITASTDSAVIAHGSYLVYGAAHCAYCHVPVERISEVAAGKKIPLSGGGSFDIPPGIFMTPNLTPDNETGIGKLTDGELARALRYSVNHNNKFMVPFMAFQDISDDDLTAIISFLRAQEPVTNAVPPNEYRFLGKALLTLGMLKPAGPTKSIKSVVKDSTIEYGSYIANSVANCVGCHTDRDMKTGEFIGEPFAGGFTMEAEPFAVLHKGYKYVTPNLTPDAGTGIMTDWSEEQFISRMKGGRVFEGSPMPWEAFATIDEVDIKALYLYLQSLDPVPNEIENIVIESEE